MAGPRICRAGIGRASIGHAGIGRAGLGRTGMHRGAAHQLGHLADQVAEYHRLRGAETRGYLAP
jgi:hypothetical protein